MFEDGKEEDKCQAMEGGRTKVFGLQEGKQNEGAESQQYIHTYHFVNKHNKILSINWRLVPSGTVATRGVHPSFIKNKRRGATSPWVSKNPTWIYIYSGLPRPPHTHVCMYVFLVGFIIILHFQ